MTPPSAPGPPEQQCPTCADPVASDDRFCESCGTVLRVRRGATVDHVSTVASAPCRVCGYDGDVGEPSGDDDGEHVDLYCPECGALRDDGSDRIVIELPTLAGVSDRGLVHVRNEDAMALGERSAPGGGATAVAAVVCDGVSSVENPQLASRAATDAGLTALLTERASGTSATDHVEAAVAAAARAVAALPYDARRGAPSCTLVAAMIEGSAAAPEITVAWVGDSRAYWLAPSGAPEPAAVLTTDHSWAVEIVAIGELDEAAAAADPRAHAITRWMGADASDEPGVMTLRPEGPGVLLLCSDGLWNYLPDADALASAAFAAGASPVEMADELTAYALDSGGRDNITVVAIPVPIAAAAPAPPTASAAVGGDKA